MILPIYNVLREGGSFFGDFEPEVEDWRYRVIDAMTDRLNSFIKYTLEAQLASVGYHRVNGTWRKARKKRKVNPEVEKVLEFKKEILEHGPRL